MIMNVNKIIKNILLLSGIMFWVFILTTFIPLPDNNIIFNILFYGGILFWMFVMPFELTVVLFLCLILVFSILKEKYSKIKSKTGSQRWRAMMNKRNFVTIDFDNKFIEFNGDSDTRIKLENKELLEMGKVILELWKE